jgi:hypothetical protein
MLNPTLVYLGPSLSLIQAKEIFPEAWYFPPARCGDITHGLRLNPRAIVIIDGYFDHTPSVWHKEILLALERGVFVYGCSSMGALRAAELAEFGMIGSGSIFRQFHSGLLKDDDEVAVLHGPSESNFRAVSDAMVNIRVSLSEAYARGLLSKDEIAKITRSAKRQYYGDRTILGAANDAGVRFQKSMQTISQKQLDAIELLNRLSSQEYATPKLPDFGSASRTHDFRTLYLYVMCRPFPYHHEALPLAESIARAARLLPAEYRASRLSGYLLSSLDSIARGGEEGTGWRGATSDLTSANCFSDYLALVNWRCGHSDRAATEAAKLWQRFDHEAIRRGAIPSERELLEAAETFRREMDLDRRDDMLGWLSREKLSRDDFARLMAITVRYDRLVRDNLMDALNVDPPREAVFWLVEGLKATGVYDTVSDILTRATGQHSDTLIDLELDLVQAMTFEQLLDIDFMSIEERDEEVTRFRS